MRFTTAYLLFLLYTIAVFGQLIPIAGDFLSHHFAEAIHIATVHARYGSNHLQKELETTNSDSNKNHSTRNADNFEVHILSEKYSGNLHTGTPLDEFPTLRLLNASAVFISKHSPPPKVS